MTTDSGGGGSTVTEEVKNVAQQVQEGVNQATQQATQQATSVVSQQKSQAADSLGSVADALRQSGQHLQKQNGGGPAVQVLDTVASRVDDLSTYLDNTSVSDMISTVERFARREPAIFLGGAFALGFLAARFLKSSPPQTGGGYPGQGYNYGGQGYGYSRQGYNDSGYGTPSGFAGSGYAGGYTPGMGTGGGYSAPYGGRTGEYAPYPTYPPSTNYGAAGTGYSSAGGPGYGSGTAPLGDEVAVVEVTDVYAGEPKLGTEPDNYSA